MTEQDKAKDWVRYFKVVPRMSTLIAAKKNDGPRVLELTMKELGLASPLDVVEKCEGDNW